MTLQTHARQAGPFASAFALLLGLAVASPAARAAPTFGLDFSSQAQYSSALYDSSLMRRDLTVASVADWNTMGRVGQTELNLLPTAADGFRSEQDQAWTWARLVQPAGGNATLRAYALMGGYYLDAHLPTLARTEVQVRNTLEVRNDGTGIARFDLMQLTHGLLVAGGINSNAVAHAEDATFLRTTCTTFRLCSDDQSNPILALTSSWGGNASVSTTLSGELLTEVNGEWEGHTFRRFKSLPDYDDDPIEGIELGLAYLSAPVNLSPGGRVEVEMDYFLRVAAFSEPGRSGFLSIAETDFSATAQLLWRALDPLTGLPASNVLVRLLGDGGSAPDPGALPVAPTALLLLAGLGLGGLTARRSPSASSP